MTSTFITICPRSLYTSLTELNIKFLGILKQEITFSRPMKLIDIKSYNANLTVDYSSDGETKVLLESKQPKDIISVKLLVEGAVTDSGWNLFPFVCAHLNLKFTLRPCLNVRVRLIFPKNLRGYIAHSYINIGNKRYDFQNYNKYKLSHESKGLIDEQISYFCSDNEASVDPTSIRVESYYRLSSYRILLLLITPYILGIPIVALWFLPYLNFIAKISLTLSIIPLIYYTWIGASAYMRDLICLESIYYAVLLLIWGLYILLSQLFGSNIYLISFTAMTYLLLLYFILRIFLQFRYRPIVDMTKTGILWLDACSKLCTWIHILLQRILPSA